MYIPCIRIGSDDVVTQISPSSSISLCADDIALYRSIRSPADYIVLQADITAITTWVEEERHLKLHADKCHLMLISRKRTCSVNPPLFAKAGTPLQQVNSVKYLGVLLTSDLSWSEHITRTCSKTRKLIGLLYRRFHHCSPELLLTLYKAFIRPHLEYAPGSLLGKRHRSSRKNSKVCSTSLSQRLVCTILRSIGSLPGLSSLRPS